MFLQQLSYKYCLLIYIHKLQASCCSCKVIANCIPEATVAQPNNNVCPGIYAFIVEQFDLCSTWYKPLCHNMLHTELSASALWPNTQHHTCMQPMDNELSLTLPIGEGHGLWAHCGVVSSRQGMCRLRQWHAWRAQGLVWAQEQGDLVCQDLSFHHCTIPHLVRNVQDVTIQPSAFSWYAASRDCLRLNELNYSHCTCVHAPLPAL